MATHHRHRRHRAEHGSMTIEAVVLGPVMVMFLLVVIVFARYASARQAVDSAADAAARAASISRTAEGGRTAAQEVALSSLDGKGVKCTSRSIDTDVSGFNAPLGVAAPVITTISCTVNLSDVTLPGLPGSQVFTAQGRSVIDAYRERR